MGRVDRYARREDTTVGESTQQGCGRRRLLARIGRRLLEVCLLSWCAFSAYSCVAARPETCTYANECPQGFCDSQGFCQSECKQDIDCPCGSTCAASCGICLRNDALGQGPATCFPLRNGLDTRDVLGVCRADLSTPTTAASQVVADAGVCVGPPVTLPECPSSPLAQRFLPSGGAGGAGGGSGGGGAGGTYDAGPDAAVDAADAADADDASEGGL